MELNKINLTEITSPTFNLVNEYDVLNANALGNTITNAERDGSSSHGLFRVPGYIASLQSGKVNGKSVPKVQKLTPVILKCNADNGFASYAHEISLPMLTEAAKLNGIAALSITGCYHFAALWPETEFLAKTLSSDLFNAVGTSSCSSRCQRGFFWN